MSDYTPGRLKVAATQGNIEVVRELLATGHDPNAEDAMGGPALHSAAINGHAEVVALLLAHGANPKQGLLEEVRDGVEHVLCCGAGDAGGFLGVQQ